MTTSTSFMLDIKALGGGGRFGVRFLFIPNQRPCRWLSAKRPEPDCRSVYLSMQHLWSGDSARCCSAVLPEPSQHISTSSTSFWSEASVEVCSVAMASHLRVTDLMTGFFPCLARRNAPFPFLAEPSGTRPDHPVMVKVPFIPKLTWNRQMN